MNAKMKRNFLRILLLVVSLVVIAGCGSKQSGEDNGEESKDNNANKQEAAVEGDGDEVLIKLAHHHAVDSIIDQVANQIADTVEENSNGNLKIEVFPGGQLGEERELITGLDMGTIDMAMVSPSIMDDYDPIFGIDTLPFIFEDGEHVARSFEGEVGEELKNILLEKSNIQIKGFIIFGARQMFTNTEVANLDDFEKLKIRSPESWVFTRMFELLNANPTPIAFGEAYTAIQTGVVHGMEVPPSMALDLNLDEVATDVALTDHIFGSMSVSMNNDLYEGLSDEQKNILDEAISETVAYFNSDVIPEEEQAALEQLEEGGITITEVEDIDDWRAAVEPMYEEFEERAPGAEKLIEMINDLK